MIEFDDSTSFDKLPQKILRHTLATLPPDITETHLTPRGDEGVDCWIRQGRRRTEGEPNRKRQNSILSAISYMISNYLTAFNDLNKAYKLESTVY